MRGCGSHARSALPQRGRVSVDPTVASHDELNASTSVLRIRVAILRHRRSLEVIERHEEGHSGAVVADEVLKQEEIHVPAEAFKQREEVAVPRQRRTKWTALALVVPSDALECEVEPVRDLPEARGPG